MASEGGGKIKSKRNQASNKPYERRTSLFGKLKNSVKDLLIPSWLSKSSEKPDVSQASSSSTLETNVNPVVAVADVNRSSTGYTVDCVSSFPTLPNSLIEQTAEKTSNSTAVSISNYVVGSHALPNSDWKSSNSQWNKSAVRTPRANCRDSDSRLRLSDSYLDDEEEADSSYTTPVKHIMVSTGSTNRSTSDSRPESKRQRLWSPEVRQGKPLIPPARDKPAFNSSLFGSSMKAKDASLLGESSFYSGKTCYGGAAVAKRRTLNTSLPYQSSLPLKKQVKATKRNSSFNATTSSTAQRILETLDRLSTPLEDARKIPHVDHSDDSVLSFTPSSYRRKNVLGTPRAITRPLQLPNRGPPTSQTPNTHLASIAVNREKVVQKSTGKEQGSSNPSSSQPSGLRVTEETYPIREGGETRTAQLSCATGKMKSKKFSQHAPSGHKVEEVCNTPALSTEFTLPASGMVPISLGSNLAALSKNVSQAASNPIHVPPDVSPIKFTFSTPIEEKNRPSSSQPLNSTDKRFQFSSPILAVGAKMSAVGAEEGSKFFPEPAVGASSGISAVSPLSAGGPIPKVKGSSPDIGGTSSSFKSYSKWDGGHGTDSSAASEMSYGFGTPSPASALKKGSVMDILGKASSKSSESSDSGKKAAKSNLSADIDLMAKFKKAPGSWDCDACMLPNKPEAAKCIACETPKPGSKPSGFSTPFAATDTSGNKANSLTGMFKPPTGSWECDSCMIQNTSTAHKCIACETPKPGQKNTSQNATDKTNSLAVMFKQPTGSWECDSCMIQNTSTAQKCVACETAKPGQKSAAQNASDNKTNSLSAMFKQPTGSWECDSCMIQNTSTAQKCVACETPKPGQKSASQSSDNSLSNMFKKPGGSWECDTCMVQNKSSQPRCMACDSPKPSLQKAGIVATTTTTSSSSDSSSVKILPTGGFSFNMPTTTTTMTGSGGFKFGNTVLPASSQPTPAASGFQFGQTSTSSTSSAPQGGSSIGGFKFGTGTSVSHNNSPVTFGATGFQVSSAKAADPSDSVKVQFGSPAPTKVSAENSIASVSSGSSSVFTSTVSTTGENLNKSNNFAVPAYSFGSSAPAASTNANANFGQTPKLPAIENHQFRTTTTTCASQGPSPVASLGTATTTPSATSSAAPKQGLFTFGASAPQTAGQSTGASTTAKLFTFGSQNAPSTNTSSLGLGATAPAPVMMNGGLTPKEAPKTNAFGFSAESGASGAKPVAEFGSSVQQPSTNGVFSFKVASNTAAAPAPAFGAKSAVPGQGGFVFGSTANPAPPAASTGGFHFSAAPKLPAPSTNSLPNSGFTFGAEAPQGNAVAPVDGKKDAGNTPSFNFGGTQANPAIGAGAGAGVFHFGTQAQVPEKPPGMFAFTGTPAAVPTPAAQAGGMGNFNVGATSEVTGRKVRKAFRRLKRQ